MKEKELLLKLNDIVSLHESMKGAYFFHSPRVAALRRRYEEQHSQVTEFDYNGHHYLVEQETTCSCRNVYYSIYYYMDGEVLYKDIRYIKKMIREIEAKIQNEEEA